MSGDQIHADLLSCDKPGLANQNLRNKIISWCTRCHATNNILGKRASSICCQLCECYLVLPQIVTSYCHLCSSVLALFDLAKLLVNLQGCQKKKKKKKNRNCNNSVFYNPVIQIYSPICRQEYSICKCFKSGIPFALLPISENDAGLVAMSNQNKRSVPQSVTNMINTISCRFTQHHYTLHGDRNNK